MVKFNYITEYQVLATSILNSEHVFLYFTPSFFVLDGKWRHQQSMRITVLLRTELVRYIEKKNTLLVHFTWNFLCEMYVKGAKY